ncbi:TauD/TfdA family dioxygenase [Streptomyces sp. NPDC059740]|uniref:TauD/TfdA family dioxygenase n=1 Tax=Streptomyces sp. NPDC059740 TaxID=3346926 RepID=UPI00365AF6E7
MAELSTTAVGGWLGGDLARREERWRIPLPAGAAAELTAAAASAAARNVRPHFTTDHSPTFGHLSGLDHTAAFAAQVRDRLSGDPGFTVVTGFPVTGRDPAEVELAYWLFGLLIGRPVSQSRKGDLLGRVEDRGADISSPVQRGYESAAELPFHADRTDVIGLLCVRPAASGGLSRLVSSKALHDLLSREHPEVLAELYRPFPNDRRGEEQPGERPWSDIPVFSRAGGHFAARYVRRFITGSQRHPQAPRLTEAQVTAMDTLDALLHRPGVSLDMDLRAGELQLINNFHILHARSAFTDGGGAGRLLLRLWLAFQDSPELPDHYAALYGATSAGCYRGGVWPQGAVPELVGRPVTAAR